MVRACVRVASLFDLMTNKGEDNQRKKWGLTILLISTKPRFIEFDD